MRCADTSGRLRAICSPLDRFAGHARGDPCATGGGNAIGALAVGLARAVGRSPVQPVTVAVGQATVRQAWRVSAHFSSRLWRIWDAGAVSVLGRAVLSA